MPDFEELSDKLHLKAKEFKSFLKYREPDTRMILYFSMGYYSEQYSQMAEEALKQGEEYQATHFSGRAMDIRRICSDLFGQYPDKDYYTGMWKMPQDIVTDTPNEVLQQIAMFCVQNIQYDPAVTQDIDNFKKELKKALRTYEKGGIREDLIEMLKDNFDDMQDQPMRLPVLFELYLLILNIDAALDTFSKKAQEEAMEEPEEDESLPGFKV